MLLRNLLLILLIFLLSCHDSNRDDKETSFQGEELYQLALTDLKAFAEKVAVNSKTSYEQAKSIVTWYAQNFDWTATDYKMRNVQEILGRKGGNCNELATVATATMKALGMKIRKVREINIHVENESRQGRAESKVAEYGFRASVFGQRHNDHVWIEIYDESSGSWFPADPSLGIVGEKEWLQARLGFGERFTLDPASKDMIAPFAIFAVDDNYNIVENRTQYYVVQGFDRLNMNKLRELSTWEEWVELIDFIDDKAQGAFEGTTNLHQYSLEIARLGQVYQQLKAEFLSLNNGS